MNLKLKNFLNNSLKIVLILLLGLVMFKVVELSMDWNWAFGLLVYCLSGALFGMIIVSTPWKRLNK